MPHLEDCSDEEIAYPVEERPHLEDCSDYKACAKHTNQGR
jgi:hypothetical protein